MNELHTLYKDLGTLGFEDKHHYELKFSTREQVSELEIEGTWSFVVEKLIWILKTDRNSYYGCGCYTIHSFAKELRKEKIYMLKCIKTSGTTNTVIKKEITKW